ncbi:FAD:protein FMN transferase [Undibacterium sp. Rencai35W]|uniref:FAD:protein FMN transferase n=1 Tax=Undibacterium sp. Rencai35W TaxID=3413046 RepID=UPI003BEFAEE2
MQIFRIPFKAMACSCELVIAATDAQQAEHYSQTAINEVIRVEHKFSRYRTDSIVSRINHSAGQNPVECDEETWALLEYADSLYLSSDTLFDITAGVLRRAWDFRSGRVPSDEELSKLSALIGWQFVERANHCISFEKHGMEIDFGGFGKEYAADRAGAKLIEAGAIYGYVNLGGDMRVIGPKPDHSPWKIGIQHPRLKGELLATIPIERGGLATSGDYERFFELNGRRYCHVIDPRSGQPVSHWQTVSVVAPYAVVAGNCTTIAMLKQSEGIDYLESTGMSYLAMDHLGVVHMNQAV